MPGGIDATIKLQWFLKQFIEQCYDASLCEPFTDLILSCTGIIQYFFDNISGLIHFSTVFHPLLFSLISIGWTIMQHISLSDVGKKETAPDVYLALQGRICFTCFSQVCTWSWIQNKYSADGSPKIHASTHLVATSTISSLKYCPGFNFCMAVQDNVVLVDLSSSSGRSYLSSGCGEIYRLKLYQR